MPKGGEDGVASYAERGLSMRMPQEDVFALTAMVDRPALGGGYIKLVNIFTLPSYSLSAPRFNSSCAISWFP